MNYIELINNFWAFRRANNLTSLEADLYYFLIQESNIRNWQNPFYCSNGMICASIGISENSLIRARIKLAEYGLIKFKGGEKKKVSPHYYLKICSINVTKGVSINGGIDVSINANINTINKTKLNKTIKLKFNYREKLLEIVKDENLVDDYLQVRKAKKLPNTETAFNQLVKECLNNEFEIAEAVKICAERGWGGFKYEWVKNQNKNNEQRNNTNEQTKPELIGGIPKHQIESLLSRFD
jgi:hypothetical protein